MNKWESIYRVSLIAGGVACLIVYSVTGMNGALTGTAGTLIGLGIDLFNSRGKNSGLEEGKEKDADPRENP